MKTKITARLLWRGLATVALGTGIAALFAGCDGYIAVQDPYYQVWYDVYGRACVTGSPAPGCDFWGDGAQIVASEDPYSSQWLLSWYDEGSYTYYDVYGYAQYLHAGFYWFSPDGIIFDENGYALNDAGQDESRDIIADVAQREAQVVQKAAKALSDKFALAEATSENIARALNDWAKIGKSRARTSADKAAFMQRIYGVSMDKALAAVDSAKNGDMSGLQQVNSDVAKYWSTDPETSEKILKSWYGKQLSEVGVK